MESLSSLSGRELHWRVDMGFTIPADDQQHYLLWDRDVAVVSAQAIWKRLEFFDLIMECGEGTYQAHIDLAQPSGRPAVAWKVGQQTSLAGFTFGGEGLITVRGWIDTASGRRLAFAPSHDVGFEYAIFSVGGPRLMTVAATAGHSIGDTNGRMVISPEMSQDPELPALVVLGFALACEELMLLHVDPARGRAFA